MLVVEAAQKEVDAAGLARLIKEWEPTHAYFEKVGARPGQGVRSMFTFGTGFGTLRGVLAALGIPYTEVPPQQWQKVLLAGIGKGDPKGAALLRAKQLWPALSFRATERSKVAHQGLVDAALIAEYGRRQQLGNQQ
jgi:crossover junction endodeoxyribonuclease RuvC